MDENEWLAESFEEHRAHLRAVAYRMLGSLSEADDAVQDAWLRLSRSGADEVENLRGWLTTIVARVCLNMLRARGVRREESLELHLPDPIVSREGALEPEKEALLADPARQRAVVDAFFAAARGGDFDALVAVLDPDVVLREDFGPRRLAASRVIHGAAAVARQARIGANPAAQLHPALVNGAAGVVVTVGGRPFAVLGFTVAEGKIVAIDAFGDPQRIRRIAAAVLADA